VVPVCFGLWARVTVETVLIDCVLHRLREVAFQFAGGDRDAIQEQDQIKGVFVVNRVSDLADDAETVGAVTCEYFGIHRQGGFELCENEGLA
jgi:hypothetical protein